MHIATTTVLTPIYAVMAVYECLVTKLTKLCSINQYVSIVSSIATAATVAADTNTACISCSMHVYMKHVLNERLYRSQSIHSLYIILVYCNTLGIT
jgi:hypothetical protein